MDWLDAPNALGGMAGTSDVAEEVGCGRRTAYGRLTELAEDGVIERRDVGNSIVWLLDGDDE